MYKKYKTQKFNVFAVIHTTSSDKDNNFERVDRGM